MSDAKIHIVRADDTRFRNRMETVDHQTKQPSVHHVEDDGNHPGDMTYAKAANPNRRRSSEQPKEHKDQKSHAAEGRERQDDRPPIVTSLSNHPKSIQRPPYMSSPDDELYEAGVARVNIAPSKEHPRGTTEDNWAERHKNQHVLQQHAEYFDPDKDGVIWPLDTYRGCRKFGWNVFLSAFAAFIIHANLSYPTCPRYVPDPFFRIWHDKAFRLKHGSGSMTYDTEGRFRPQQFEEIFTKYDRENKGGLSFRDILRLWDGQKMVLDFFGWSATFLEWLGVYLLLWPEDGVMRKEDVRRVFDGSIFYKKAEEHQRRRMRSNGGKARPWRWAVGLVSMVFTLFWATRNFLGTSLDSVRFTGMSGNGKRTE